jgi:hypothetical protein
MHQPFENDSIDKVDRESIGFIKGALLMLGLLALYGYAPKIIAAIATLVTR